MKKDIDITKAVEIADQVWWVGHYLENDPFQCHVYLIENGTESILIDPGSKLTFRHTLAKINQVIPFENIKYLICQHQDPDITAALPEIEEIVTREDMVIISHWRAIALLKHYGLKMPFVCVEDKQWKMDIGGRILKFIFTPYLHFPGAFCTFDVKTNTLFSSDIFGAFTENWSLFARDESYLEALRPFHEHYMPSREILNHAIHKMEQYPVERIAPQHGSIITGDLVKFIMAKVKNIECGLYLMTQTSTDVIKLSRLNKILRNFVESLIVNHNFKEIVNSLIEAAGDIFPVGSLSFYAENQDSTVLLFSPETMYRGIVSEIPGACKHFIGMSPERWRELYESEIVYMNEELTSFADPGVSGKTAPAETVSLILPLYTIDHPSIHGIAVFQLKRKKNLDPEEIKTLLQLSVPLSVVVEREIILRTMELEKQKFYEQAIHDPLTNLYTRTYMNDAVARLFHMQDREKSPPIYLFEIDVDYFKRINDSYGHSVGDAVLKDISTIIIEETRSTDIQVRLGGEEFAIFLPLKNEGKIYDIVKRIRERISKIRFDIESISGNPISRVTISGGIIKRRINESIEGAIFRADMLMYESKKTGRDKIIFDLS